MRAASENERLAYTVNEAAAIAGVNRRTLYKERQAGKLQMLTVQGRTMIRADELHGGSIAGPYTNLTGSLGELGMATTVAKKCKTLIRRRSRRPRNPQPESKFAVPTTQDSLSS
jgi:hypothetical protein